MKATDPRQPRTTAPPCAYCEASARGCDTNVWLRGRRCCEACEGHTTTRARCDDAPTRYHRTPLDR